MTARARASSTLLACLLATGLAAGQEAPSPAGAWSGSIGIEEEGDVNEVEIEIRRTPDGFWTGLLLTGTPPAEPIRLTAVTVTAQGIRFTAEGMPGAPEFVGRLSPDGREILGEAWIEPPAPPPGADVFLAPIEHRGKLWSPGVPINVTDRDGYDNQPRFLADASALLYTSIRDQQADIYRYDVAGGETVRLTETTESEYSPTPLPSSDGFSTVRVEEDGTQRLWSFDLSGAEPALLLESVQPVGYHGWLDEHRLGLFVLGSPPTLQLADVMLQSSETVAENIGRSIHVTPDGRAVSFISKPSPEAWEIQLIGLDDRARRTVIATRAGSEDFVWTPDGQILMAEGSELFVCDPGAKSPAWRMTGDLAPHGVHGITRLDVSSDFRWLAVVGERLVSGPPAERLRRPFSLLRRE